MAQRLLRRLAAESARSGGLRSLLGAAEDLSSSNVSPQRPVVNTRYGCDRCCGRGRGGGGEGAARRRRRLLGAVGAACCGGARRERRGGGGRGRAGGGAAGGWVGGGAGRGPD